jgi:hypothetical protein
MNSFKNKIRVAWFSNLDEENSLVESYSSYVTKTLYPYLANDFDIQVFSPNPERDLKFKSKHYLTASIEHKRKPFDICFYQLEDRADCQWQRILTNLIPGITYFHDFLFTTYGPEPILNSTWHTMVDNYNLAADLWPNPLDKQEQSGPHAHREMAYCAKAIFSQPTPLEESNRIIKKRISNLPAAYLPFPIEENIFSLRNRANSRRVALLASPWIQERAHIILEAISNFDLNLPVSWLIEPDNLSLTKELIEQYKLTNVEIVIGKTVENWQKIVEKSDLAIHLLFSVFGQNGPYLPMSMAMGRPCLVTNFANSEYLPDNLVFKIQSGESESREIEEVLKLVLDKKIMPDANLISAYAYEHYFSKVIASELKLIFEQSVDEIASINQKWQELQKRARVKLIDKAISLLPYDVEEFNNSPIAKVYKEFGWC